MPPQQLRVARTEADACRHLVVEDLHLREQHGGLDRVEAPGEPEPRVVIAPVLPVQADLTHESREVVVVGEERTAVAVGTQGLRGKNDVAPISDSAQDLRPLYVAPKLCAASSTTGRLCLQAMALMASKSAHCP